MAQAGSGWRRLTPNVASHGRALLGITIVSGVGILSSFLFQIVAARTLGPAEFGIVSAFFAIVSMAAIGSSSLQNSVAVQTAAADRSPSSRVRRVDGFTIEAIVLGGIAGVAIFVASPLIADRLATMLYVPMLAAVAAALSFGFARSVGSIQGVGRSQAAVGWTTFSLVIRVVLFGLAGVLGWGLPGVLAAILVGIVVSLIGAEADSLRTRPPVAHRPFRLDGVVVILLTIAWAWLTNVDVILVRAETTPATAGIYAAAATLVKSGFLVPATLSLYLLPRFVRQRTNAGMTRLGVRAVLLVSVAGSLVIVGVMAAAGAQIIGVLYGSAFRPDAWLVTGIAVAMLPWVVAQGILIRVTSIASRVALVGLVVLAAVQVLLGTVLLPDLAAFLVMTGALGVLALILFVVVDRRAIGRLMRDGRVADGHR